MVLIAYSDLVYKVDEIENGVRDFLGSSNLKMR